jgi:hypothetical protein
MNLNWSKNVFFLLKTCYFTILELDLCKILPILVKFDGRIRSNLILDLEFDFFGLNSSELRSEQASLKILAKFVRHKDDVR